MRKLLTTLVLLAPSLALAQKPTITLQPFTGPILAPTAPYCGFDMIDTPWPGKPNAEKLIQFADAGLVSGPLFVQLKNANTGQTIYLNSSGPATSITVRDDGSTVIAAKGPGIWNYPPPPLEITKAAGLPAVPYIKGNVTVVIDPNGNISSLTLTGGTAEDICAMFK